MGLKKEKKSEDEKTEAVPSHDLLSTLLQCESSGKLRFSSYLNLEAKPDLN